MRFFFFFFFFFFLLFVLFSLGCVNDVQRFCAWMLSVAGDVFDGIFFVLLSFFSRDVLGEIWGLIESVSQGFPT